MRIKRITSDVGDRIARAAVWMLTIGVLLSIWGGVWLVYLLRNPPGGEGLYIIAAGVFLSGLDLLAISLVSGRIGRAARDTPPEAEREPERIAIATPESAVERRG